LISLADSEKIDGLRAPWSLADTGQALFLNKTIQQPRFAYVTTPQEGKLRQLLGRELPRLYYAHYKSGGEFLHGHAPPIPDRAVP